MAKINNKQKEVLIDFMSTNYDYIIYGKFAKQNRRELKEFLWKRLTDKMNEAGPPEKTAELWKRVSDLLFD